MELKFSAVTVPDSRRNTWAGLTGQPIYGQLSNRQGEKLHVPMQLAGKLYEIGQLIGQIRCQCILDRRHSIRHKTNAMHNGIRRQCVDKLFSLCDSHSRVKNQDKQSTICRSQSTIDPCWLHLVPTGPGALR